MKKSVFKSLLLLCTTSLLCACVNEEYDLNKEIDNNITILKNIGIPIGNLEPITIEDFISPDNQDVLKTESNGDFYFSIDGEYISEDLSFLNLDITDNNFRTNDISILFPTSSFSGLGGLLPDLTLNYSDVIGSPLNTTIDFEVDSPVATGITDVKSVDVDAIVYVDFSISSGACYLKSGFKLKLPDNLHFTLLDNSGKFTLTSNNILTVSNDCKVSGNTPLRVKLKVDKITVPSNSVKDGNLQIADNIVLSGDFYVKTNDFTSIPSNLEVLINFSVYDVNVKSAVVSINLSETFEGATMEIPELPQAVQGIHRAVAH